MRLRLRSRLALGLAVLVIPFAVGLSLFRLQGERRALEEATAAAAIARMDAGQRERCEAAPERWPQNVQERENVQERRAARRLRSKGKGKSLGMRRDRAARRMRRMRAGPAAPVAVWAFDSDFQSRNRRAPVFDPELREELEGEDVASVSAGDRGRWIAVRMPWEEGPCAILLVRRPAEDEGVILRSALVPSLVTSLAAIVIAILVAGPIVGRVRRLTDAARRPVTDPSPIDVGGSDEIGELAGALDDSRKRIRAQLDELEKRDEALRSYIANTTHDVMTPLTVLQGHLSAMERSLAADEPVEPVRVRDALEEAHYLSSLLKNMNAAARLEMTAGEPRTAPIDLNDAVEKVVARHRPFARQRRVAMDFAVPETETRVLGDLTLVEQAIGNLVHNAIRYNRSDGHVAVVLERTPDRFDLRVIDDGPGLDPAELERVAERGYRSDRARSRHPHGMGLGLSITRDVAERHGWHLELESPDGGGLTAHLRGPLDHADPTA